MLSPSCWSPGRFAPDTGAVCEAVREDHQKRLHCPGGDCESPDECTLGQHRIFTPSFHPQIILYQLHTARFQPQMLIYCHQTLLPTRFPSGKSRSLLGSQNVQYPVFNI
jgi:hypothetical protein